MYASDYGYAASPSAWTTNLSNYSNSTIPENNWLFMGLNEWLITPFSSLSSCVFDVFYMGFLVNSDANLGDAVRPTFHLKSTVTLASGSGTISDPYKLSI